MSTATVTPSASGLYLPGTPPRQSVSQQCASPHSFLETSIAEIEKYARKEPLIFASWVFGIGFVLGWKLKPW